MLELKLTGLKIWSSMKATELFNRDLADLAYIDLTSNF